MLPTTGGVIKTMDTENSDYNFISLDGIENCIDAIEEIIAEIYELFNKPWLINSTEYYSTMSMGVVCFPDDGTEVSTIAYGS